MAELKTIQRLKLTFNDITRMLLINLAATAFVFLLNWFGTSSRVHFRDILVSAFVFSNCIGTLISLMFFYQGNWFMRSHQIVNWIKILFGLVAATFVGCAVAQLIMAGLGYSNCCGYWAGLWQKTRFGVLVSFIFGINGVLYQTLQGKLDAASAALRKKEAEEQRARQLATEARLASLESRLHPHFLFNTLNSISSLIQDDPKRAERMVEQLAALLRFSLDANQYRTVPLRQELKIVRDYLEIEKVRFAERLRFCIRVPTELESVEVPPLSIQTLVENGVKYAVAPRRQGAEIKVSVEQFDDRVMIFVADDGPGMYLDDLPAGHGLDTLQSRLETLFGTDSKLLFTTGKEGNSVAFGVPARQPVEA